MNEFSSTLDYVYADMYVQANWNPVMQSMHAMHVMLCLCFSRMCMHAWMHACIHGMYVCMYVCMYAYTHARVYTCMHMACFVYASRMHVCTIACGQICVRVCVCVCVFVWEICFFFFVVVVFVLLFACYSGFV